MVEIAIKPVCVGVSNGGLSRCEADNTLFGDEAAMAAISGQVAAALSQDPFAYLSDTDTKIAALWQRKFDEYSHASMFPVALSISFKWQPADAAAMAVVLRGANPKKKGAFLDFARHSGDIQFVGAVMATMSYDAKGAGMAGKMLADLKDPKLGVAILYSIPNPARGARILNYWEHYTGSDKGVVEIESAFLKKMDPQPGKTEDELRYRHRMLLAYRQGATMDSDESDVGGREKVLKVFDDYELSRDRAALEKRIAELRDEKILRDCRVLDFKEAPDGRVENLECRFAKDEFAERVKAIRAEMWMSGDELSDKVFADHLARILAAEGIPPSINDWYGYKRWTDAADRAAREMLADKRTMQALCKAKPELGTNCAFGDLSFRGVSVRMDATNSDNRSVDVTQRVGGRSYEYSSTSETFESEGMNLNEVTQRPVESNHAYTMISLNLTDDDILMNFNGMNFRVPLSHDASPFDEDISTFYENKRKKYQGVYDCLGPNNLNYDVRCLCNYFTALGYPSQYDICTGRRD